MCLARDAEIECHYNENGAVYKSTRKPVGNLDKNETGK